MPLTRYPRVAIAHLGTALASRYYPGFDVTPTGMSMARWSGVGSLIVLLLLQTLLSL